MDRPIDQPPPCTNRASDHNHDPKIVLPAPPASPPECSAILQQYGRPDMHFVSATSARLLVDGDQAFPLMLAAINGAQRTVALETYILRSDASGTAFQQALINAAARGVMVRLLYDWIGSLSLATSFLLELVHAGVAVAAYHPVVLLRPFLGLNRRDHRKILIVDGEVSFTGGLNLADEYITSPNGEPGWRDTHVRLEGPEVAREMTALFTYGWRRAVPFEKTLTRRARLAWGLRRRFFTRRHRISPPQTASCPHGLPVSILGNEESRYRRRIRRAHLKAIASAQRYILLANGYFIPDRIIRRALIMAVQRGVKVAVMVTARSDIPITSCATRWLYGALLSGGVQIFEWPLSMMHAKTAVFDDVWSIIGSYNFDKRSLLHQLESVAVIADPQLATQLREQTLADISQCSQVSLETHRRRPWWKKTIEYLAYQMRYWL